MALDFRVLGGVALFRDGAEVTIGGNRPQALLALLLVQRGRPLSIDAIVDRIWPDDPPPTATKTVQVYVSRLRAALDDDRDRLGSRAGGYELTIAPAELDASRFESHLRDAGEAVAAGANARALAALDRAFGSWRGRPFGDLADEPFLRHETDRLEDLKVEAEELRSTALVAAGRASEAIGPLRRLTSEHPTRESAWRALILALYAAGRQSDALEAFHRIRLQLDEELGIEPGPELQAAHLAVLQQSAPAPGRADRPRRLVAQGAAESQLVGRSQDVARIEQALADGARLVTLTGPGGIGKTSLCTELLARMRPALDGPVVFVGLDAVRSVDLLPSVVAAALGGAGDPVEQLGTADALLGLDNLEQIPNAGAWVSDLLQQCPGLQIVATSRVALRISHELLHQVGPLDADAARELFVARARRVRPDLDGSPAIDAICARLDRLPLAIELAAARSNLLSPDALLHRLDHALDILRDGRRESTDRQRTVRSAIAWSYDILEPSEQQVLARLGVFAGGFGLEAAEVVAGATLDVLDSLLGQSLVSVIYDEPEPRFFLLETIRAFALERLADAGDHEATRSAHGRWALDLAERSRAKDARLDDDAMRRLARELDNFREAMEWAASTGADVVRWRLAAALSDVWQTRGLLAEGRRWLETGLDEATIPDDLRAEVVDDASTMAFRQGRLEDAERLASQQLSLAQRVGQPRRAVAAVAKLAQIALQTGALQRARELHAEARAMAEKDGDPLPLLVSLTGQANADLLDGRADLAAATFEQCLAIASEHGSPESVATAHFNVGLARVLDGRDQQAAREALGEALDRYVALEDVEGIAYVLVAVAGLREAGSERQAGVALGASESALALAGAALEAVEAKLFRATLDRLETEMGAAALGAARAEGLVIPPQAWAELAREALGTSGVKTLGR